MVKLFWRLWHSPTFTTWGSYFAGVINWVAVLPLLLTRFSTAEIALWYLFKIIMDLRPIADVGFSTTFIREISYAFGGANDIASPIKTDIDKTKSQPNWDLLRSTYLTMEGVYNRLALIIIGILLLSSVIFIRPISQIENPKVGWIAWGIIIITIGLGIRGNSYSSLLYGFNKIALYRRWDALFGTIVSVASLVILQSGGGLLELVIANQSWILLSYIRNRLLAKRVAGDHIKLNFLGKIDQNIYTETWSRTWRSGLGLFMNYGISQISGVIYAQLGTGSSVASYLLALRFAQTITSFSGAPFYSKLPYLASIYPQNKKPEMTNLASKGMKFSYWVFVAGFIIVGALLPPFLMFIGSNAEFVSPSLWAILGFGFLFERFGSMHLQFYSLTNHIIWHIANGISGIITIISIIALYGLIGIYAFPVGFLMGYLGFYAWYSAKHSYKAFGIKFINFEKKTSLPSFLVFGFSMIAINILPINKWIGSILNIFTPLLKLIHG